MIRINPVISVKEARKILGKMAESMSDQEIAELVGSLDVLAIEALRLAREKRMKEDAMALAQLTYDIYQDKKPLPDNRDKKE